MNMLLWNLLLALAWAIATGSFNLANFTFGFVLGFHVLYVARRAVGSSSYFVKVPQIAVFLAFYFWELILANLRVAYDVITPKHHMRPGVLALPLDARTDAEITLLANLITLTPGTLSLDLSADRKTLYLHVMYLDGDVASVKRDIKERLERRVLEVLR